MTAEESLRLARLHIEYLERMLDEADARYAEIEVQCWEYRNHASSLEFSIRKHKESVVARPASQSAANEELWKSV
jgi:hypothetical protein